MHMTVSGIKICTLFYKLEDAPEYIINKGPTRPSNLIREFSPFFWNVQEPIFLTLI